MPSPTEIAQRLDAVRDKASFLDFLRRALLWPIDQGVEDVEDISYKWTAAELRAADLDKKLLDGQVSQIANLDANQPWGVFVLEFASVEPFLAERGMTGTLRKVLRGLVPSRRRDAAAPSWKREHLLFICTHKYEHFRIAYFKAPLEGSKTAPLAAFGWGPDIPARTACEFNLPSLVWPDDPRNAAGWVSAWAGGFDVEKVTKRFYTDYAALFERLRASIKGVTGEEQKMFTQTLLNRLMFLRFIERKGWLIPPGGEKSKDYLRLLFGTGGYRGKSFYSGRLKKLFFEALAIEGKQESEAIGKVPFLNGGLFEESELDKKVDDIPDAAFTPLLGTDGLFYRYNFTVQESTPLDIEVAVDPEMLGKVFEELVTGRHESGSYYTPRPVVSFMCREALKGYLTGATKLDANVVELFVDQHDVGSIKLADARKIAEALENVRAVDPACGSGAYLLGLLHEIVDLYRLLYSDKLKTDARELHRIKLDIIQNCLYGVDIDPFATNIAMLRLWLSLTVDSDSPHALPNLDFKIETGNSLTGPNPQDLPDLIRAALVEKARQLAAVKGKYMRAQGDEKKSLRGQVLKEQREIGFNLRSLSPGSIDWRVQFCEVFFDDRAGFDIVLANPPYIDSETMTATQPEIRQQISRSYLLTKGNWDIYIAFFELGFRLLGPEAGMLAYITPDKWLSKPFGAALRQYKLQHVRSILNVGRTLFEGAKVDAIVSVFGKQATSAIRILSMKEGRPVLNRIAAKAALVPPYSLDWLFSKSADLLDRIEKQSTRLSTVAKCENACATSDAYKLKPLIRELKTGESIREDLLKIINTGTIGKYVSKWGNREMVYLGNRFLRPVVNIEEFSRVFSNSYGSKSVKPKIIIKGLNLLDACIDIEGRTIPGKTTLIVTAKEMSFLKVALAILNSDVAMFYLRERYPASTWNTGTTFTKEMINDLPIPQSVGEYMPTVINLVDQILAAGSGEARNVGDMEVKLNRIVVDMYGLTAGDLQSGS